MYAGRPVNLNLPGDLIMFPEKPQHFPVQDEIAKKLGIVTEQMEIEWPELFSQMQTLSVLLPPTAEGPKDVCL